jgi:hypothetical protein
MMSSTAQASIARSFGLGGYKGSQNLNWHLPLWDGMKRMAFIKIKDTPFPRAYRISYS